jgi:aspartyl-tRNA(Asn)/glutamyl-tRNA(Gln) amidotransferase subunit A
MTSFTSGRWVVIERSASRTPLQTARNRIALFADLHAFISVSGEEGRGDVVAVKDLIDVKGMITTGGGVILPRLEAEDDAPLIKEIRKHACVVVGKTNLHEWAFGPTSINPHYGAVLNPHDTTRMAGGSSGGSAVAAATGMCDWAIGTDTGGSIRLPAALCGVVGFKPSPELIETRGVIPVSQSLDVVGSIARDVRTAAMAVEMMSGRSLSLPAALPSQERYRLAVPEGWVEGLDGPVAAAWAELAPAFEEIPFPSRERIRDVAMTVIHAEATANHRDWLQSSRDKYGSDVLAYLEAGNAITSEQYQTALASREEIAAAAESAMSEIDALILPTTACVAPKLDATEIREPLTRFTRAFNLTRQPAITIPLPTSGLPVGIQLVARHGEDALLVQVALALEAHLRGLHAAGQESERVSGASPVADQTQ